MQGYRERVNLDGCLRVVGPPGHLDLGVQPFYDTGPIDIDEQTDIYPSLYPENFV